jgi:hypothetical protein
MRHNWKTPFENLEHTKPDVTHLHVFGCSAYVFLLEEVHHNKLNPKSELMTFIGYPQGVKGYLSMRSPNNVLFAAVQALFDKTLYPKCPDMHCSGYTPAPDQPDGEQGEYNCYKQLLFFFSSSLTCDYLMLFILLILTQVYLQEYTSYQTHVQHVFASW